MGWGIAGGVLGIILMFGAYKWATSWATARAGGTYIPTIGSRPRRLAGVPEEAPPDAIMPPAMEVLRYGEEPVVVPDASERSDEQAGDAPVIVQEEAGEAMAPEAEEEIETISAGEGSGVVIASVVRGAKDQGEYVVIENTGATAVQLKNWKLTDSNSRNEYVFGNVVIRAGASLRVHMWAGKDTATDVYVGRRRSWWSEGGDVAQLYDASGHLVYSQSVAVADD
ncbi:MAG TPA: lamin tail domain-containing protein [Thermomicrobiales bacterium]|nr:lamin tail domain-containing protein [Thermomicrobiales bacterium]